MLVNVLSFSSESCFSVFSRHLGKTHNQVLMLVRCHNGNIPRDHCKLGKIVLPRLYLHACHYIDIFSDPPRCPKTWY